ncbi:hypothetical protein V6N13_146606 [Hibiscus sabdariffa]
MFLQPSLVPPYCILVDTNFINFSIQNKLDLEKGMMDCLYAKSQSFIVATRDRDMKRRIRRVPGVPIMYITQHKYSIERLPEATIGGGRLHNTVAVAVICFLFLGSFYYFCSSKILTFKLQRVELTVVIHTVEFPARFQNHSSVTVLFHLLRGYSYHLLHIRSQNIVHYKAHPPIPLVLHSYLLF